MFIFNRKKSTIEKELKLKCKITWNGENRHDLPVSFTENKTVNQFCPKKSEKLFWVRYFCLGSVGLPETRIFFSRPYGKFRFWQKKILVCRFLHRFRCTNFQWVSNICSQYPHASGVCHKAILHFRDTSITSTKRHPTQQQDGLGGWSWV